MSIMSTSSIVAPHLQAFDQRSFTAGHFPLDTKGRPRQHRLMQLIGYGEPDAQTALQRAIGNLLQNAPRYAPDSPVELVCTVSDEGARIGVLDRGPGIAADQIEAMFEPFHRLDASRSPATGGHGLGMAIVRELARVNGWRVTLTARPGGGLQAWLELPNDAAHQIL